MIAYNTLVVLIGVALLGANAGLVGTFAVLRRRALTGDALAHAALPGIGLGFLIAGERFLPALLLGALVTGILGTWVISSLQQWTRIREDAAIGIVLSVFFGAGVALSQYIQQRTTTGSKAGLDSYIFGKTAGMLVEDVYLIGGVSLVCLLILLVLYNKFKLISFDVGFAQSLGWPAFLLDLLLMGLIALTVVIGLSTVGVVMIAALLILPASAARFWTERLEWMLVIAVGMGVAMAGVGTMVSANYKYMPAGPVIVLVGTALFTVSCLFAPRRGILARWLAGYRFRQRLRQHKDFAEILE